MTTVTANPANKNFVRRNILTKGAVVATGGWQGKITSRPGQDGDVNAVLIEQ
jgi:small subunit ribosomal protein S8e